MAALTVGVIRARRVAAVIGGWRRLITGLMVMLVVPEVFGRHGLRLVRTVRRRGRPDELERHDEEQQNNDQPAAHGRGF